MCRVVYLRYACGHTSPRQWLVAQHPTGQCTGLVYETAENPFTTPEQCPACTDILRARGFLPNTDAGRQMELGFARYSPDYRDPRLNYGNQIITEINFDEHDTDSDSSYAQLEDDIQRVTDIDEAVEAITETGHEESDRSLSPLYAQLPMTDINGHAVRSPSPNTGTNDYGEFVRWAPDDNETDRMWYGSRLGDDGPGTPVNPNDARPLADLRRTAANSAFVPPTLRRSNAITSMINPEHADTDEAAARPGQSVDWNGSFFNLGPQPHEGGDEVLADVQDAGANTDGRIDLEGLMQEWARSQRELAEAQAHRAEQEERTRQIALQTQQMVGTMERRRLAREDFLSQHQETIRALPTLPAQLQDQFQDEFRRFSYANDMSFIETFIRPRLQTTYQAELDELDELEREEHEQRARRWMHENQHP